MPLPPRSQGPSPPPLPTHPPLPWRHPAGKAEPDHLAELLISHLAACIAINEEVLQGGWGGRGMGCSPGAACSPGLVTQQPPGLIDIESCKQQAQTLQVQKRHTHTHTHIPSVTCLHCKARRVLEISSSWRGRQMRPPRRLRALTDSSSLLGGRTPAAWQSRQKQKVLGEYLLVKRDVGWEHSHSVMCVHDTCKHLNHLHVVEGGGGLLNAGRRIVHRLTCCCPVGTSRWEERKGGCKVRWES
jgi:hypothetical protein